MSITATASSNYSAALALSAGAGTVTSAPGSGRAALIAAVLTRILQPNADSTNSAPPANSSAAIILTQLLSSTQSIGSTNSAVPMELNLNQLLNNTVLQKAQMQLPAELLAKPQVIEALVLKNTLLPTAAGKEQSALPTLLLPTPANAAQTQTTGARYHIHVEWQNKLIQLLSPQPLPAGTRVPLQIDTRGAITLLSPELGAKMLLAQNSEVRAVAQQPVQAPAPLLPPAPTTPAQTLQQSLRELLPRQQALHTLVPLLQKFIAPAMREQLPPPVFKALAQLLQSLPKPAQLRTPENVKQAINNSGSFLEAKLTQAASATAGAEPLPKIATTDLKAQISSLITLVRQHAPTTAASATATQTASLNPSTAAATPNTTAVIANTAALTAALAGVDDPAIPTPSPHTAATAAATQKPAASTATFVAEEDFIYAKPSVQNAPSDTAPTTENESLDTLLSQLGKLLQAGFARIQLNQLDSVSARHIHHDTQAPVPTWVLELPLRTPHGVDQLQLRIEQQRKQQQQQTRVQWNVEIAFDLHAAGKLAASLAIIGKSVSATLWAEHEKTHQRVRDEMSYLRAGLESVGVKVTEMQCRLGLPTPRANPISQQLVDVHT